MPELDAALVRVLGANMPTSVAAVGPAIKNALVGLAHLHTLTETMTVGRSARLKLLTLWGSIPTFGSSSLYAQLFLARSAGTDTRAFDRVTGPPLPDVGLFLSSQLAAVQAATSTTTADIVRILAHASGPAVTPESAPLTLDTVSLIYRYALLAAGLRMTMADLIELKELSGIDPFQRPPATLDFTAASATGAATVEFVRLATLLRESGVTVADLRFLLLNEDRGGDSSRPAASSR